MKTYKFKLHKKIEMFPSLNVHHYAYDGVIKVGRLWNLNTEIAEIGIVVICAIARIYRIAKPSVQFILKALCLALICKIQSIASEIHFLYGYRNYDYYNGEIDKQEYRNLRYTLFVLFHKIHEKNKEHEYCHYC